MGPQASEDHHFLFIGAFLIAKQGPLRERSGELFSFLFSSLFPCVNWSFAEASMEFLHRTHPTSGQSAQFPGNKTRWKGKCLKCCLDHIYWHWPPESYEPRRRAGHQGETYADLHLIASLPHHVSPLPPSAEWGLARSVGGELCLWGQFYRALP